jgi:hypothetical protein
MKMNDLGIISVYLVAAAFTAAVVMGGWIFCEVSWWIFTRIFGLVDSMIQERHWRKMVTAADLDQLKKYMDEKIEDLAA